MTHCLQIIDQSYFYLQSSKYLKKLLNKIANKISQNLGLLKKLKYFFAD